MAIDKLRIFVNLFHLSHTCYNKYSTLRYFIITQIFVSFIFPQTHAQRSAVQQLIREKNFTNVCLINEELCRLQFETYQFTDIINQQIIAIKGRYIKFSNCTAIAIFSSRFS